MKTKAQVDAPRYSRERWEAAQQSWRDGEPWSEEWREWRTLAANNGIPDAPEGTKWDQWDDEHPSERAQVIHAIRETPALLRRAITDRSTHSWAAVVAIIVRHRVLRFTDAIEREERGSFYDPSPEEASRLWMRLIGISQEGALGAIRAGKCPTCGQALAS